MKSIRQFFVLALFFNLSNALAQSADAEVWGTTSSGGANSNGTIFKIDCSGNHVVVYEFPNAATNGSAPVGSLMQHSNGLIYGVANTGGTNNLGVIFSIDPATSTYAKLYDFNATSGQNPEGSLIEGANGNLYGLTYNGGGSPGQGTLYEFNPATSAFTVRFLFGAAVPDIGALPTGTPLLASNGLMYLLTSEGGASGVGSLYEFNPATFAMTKKIDFSELDPLGGGFPYSSRYPWASLIEANDGMLYGVAGTDGTTGSLFQYNYNTGVLTSKHEFSDLGGALDGLDLFGTLLEAADGKLYGVASSGGAGGGGTIYTYDIGNGTFEKVKDLSGTGVEVSRGGLVQMPNGKMYGVSLAGTHGNVFEFDPTTTDVTVKVPFDGTNGSQPIYTTLAKAWRKHEVTFNTLPAKTYTDIDFNLAATTPAGNDDIVFSSADPLIASVSGNTVTINKAGEVIITASHPGNCLYSAEDTEQTLTITKSVLTAKAVDQEKDYGDTNPELTVIYEGFRGAETSAVLDTPPLASTTADETSDPGEYDIVVAGGSDDNYSFTYEDATLFINKAILFANVSSVLAIYGDEVGEFQFEYVGFRNDDDATDLDELPTISGDVTAQSDVGEYDLIASGGADNHYAITLVDGLYVIDKKDLTAIADDKTRKYGEENPPLTIRYEGFVNNDDASELDNPPFVFTEASEFSDVGVYQITIDETFDDNNYFVTVYDHGTLTIEITDQEITFTPEIISKTLGDDPVDFMAVATSGLPVEIISLNNKTTIVDGMLVLNEAGREDLFVLQEGNNNYNPATLEVSFCINPPKPTIIATGQNSPIATLSSSSDSGNEWYFNGEKLPNATAETFSVETSGFYEVRVVVDDCISEFSEPANVVIVGDLHEPITLRYYPNPVTDVLYVEGLSAEVNLSVTDISGRSYETSPVRRDDVYQLSVNHLSAGFYVLHASSVNGIRKIKFLKK